jgi:hypothetical protein
VKGVEGSGLFSDYVNMFLKGKQEASGWPSRDMSAEDKASYLEDYHEVEGILLEEEKIGYNPGKRATNKLLLNSFWGKFGESNNHRIHKVLCSGEEVLNLLANPSLEIKDLHVITDCRCMFEYDYVRGFLPEMSHVNIFIAAFTTANARMRLYDVLVKLDRRVIYFDTDSVVYEYNENDHTEYIPDMGDHLGQWTNELSEGEHISEFASSGPKSYVFKTNLGRKVTKLKGHTLNSETLQKLNFESVKKLVLFWADPDNNTLPEGEDPFVSARYDKILRDKHRFLLYSKEQIKKFRVTYNKRQLVRGTYDTVPYGF